MDFFSVQTTFFTVLNYPMSYLEFFGTVFNLLSVYLMIRRNLWTWPTGLIAVVLFALLVYQYQLYADALEQGYYFLINLYGWWHWSRSVPGEKGVSGVGFSPRRVWLTGLGMVTVISLSTGVLLAHIHQLAPVLFPQPAAFPYWDATTTVMSFYAMWLQARKRTECWLYWLVVNVVQVVIYWLKDIRFVSLLYVLFIGMAVAGLLAWLRVDKELREEPATW